MIFGIEAKDWIGLATAALIALNTGIGLFIVRRIEVVHKLANSLATKNAQQEGLIQHAAGKEEGRIEGEAKAATLAKGALAESKKGKTK